MRWSFSLGRIFGIPVRVHVTFLLLLIFVYVVFSRSSQSAAAGLFAVLFTCVLFACVLAHELGHSVAARWFGTRTRGIVLLPIGGVALLEHIPREAHKEIAIALAGPLVSAALAAMLLAVALWLGVTDWSLAFVLDRRVLHDPANLSASSFVVSLLMVNVMLILFNLIPAFPMDGGRVLRGLLSLVFGWEEGTRWAARLGQLAAVLFVLAGLASGGSSAGSWSFVLIGLFIFFGAGEEERLAQVRTSLASARVDQAMVRSFATLAPTEKLLDALATAVRCDQNDFPVLQDGRVVGIATHERMLEGIRSLGLGATVGMVMDVDFPYTSPDADLESISMEILRHGRSAIPVVNDGELVGILSWEQIQRFGRIRRRVREVARRKGHRPLSAAGGMEPLAGDSAGSPAGP